MAKEDKLAKQKGLLIFKNLLTVIESNTAIDVCTGTFVRFFQICSQLCITICIHHLIVQSLDHHWEFVWNFQFKANMVKLVCASEKKH
jgi:hypothetical protein